MLTTLIRRELLDIQDESRWMTADLLLSPASMSMRS